VAEQHLVLFLNKQGEMWLFNYSPHFMIRHMLIPAYTTDRPKTP